MGLFDDAFKNSVPGGNLTAPIAVAAGALILGKLFGGGASSQDAESAALPPQSPRQQSVPANPPAGNLVGGLNDLIGKLTQGGLGQQVNSWVGTGANQPVQPGQLGAALGQDTLDELAARAGMSREQLLNQLAPILPEIINRLTPQGRVPTATELEPGGFDSAFRRGP
jgi:uncharacterized protein YidB (DUF937 family)